VTLEQLGNLGEFIASIATLVTLAYLALQIRQSNRSNQIAGIQRIASSTEGWADLILENPGLERIWRRGMSDPASLDAEERGRFDLLVFRYLRGLEAAWLQYRWGIVDEGHWQGYVASIAYIAGSPGGREAFARNRRFFDTAFVDEVDRILRERA
jgi:hypothetical protein